MKPVRLDIQSHVVPRDRISVRTLASTLLVLAIVAFLGIKAYWPQRFFEITLVSQKLDQLSLYSTRYLVKPDSQGVVRVNLVGTWTKGTASSVTMRLKGDFDERWYQQPCCEISNGTLFGSFQLGSAEYPMTSDGSFLFIIETIIDKSVVASGVMDVKVISVAGDDDLTIAAVGLIGLLAAVLQIWQIVFPPRHRRLEENQSPKIEPRNYSERAAQPQATDKDHVGK